MGSSAMIPFFGLDSLLLGAGRRHRHRYRSRRARRILDSLRR